jgi:hypothetical protein
VREHEKVAEVNQVGLCGRALDVPVALLKLLIVHLRANQTLWVLLRGDTPVNKVMGNLFQSWLRKDLLSFGHRIVDNLVGT